MTPPAVTRVPADGLRPGHPTPGMVRHEAVVLPGLWSGRARTDPAATSGWHHHGEHDTIAYVADGVFRVETAEGVVDGLPGDFVHIPPYVVHRESNPSDRTAEVVLVRRGTGEVVVNVDGPA